MPHPESPLPAEKNTQEPLLSVVVRVLRGARHDYVFEAVNRAILLLAIPMVLEMLMTSLFAIVDIFWVSRLGREAVAVVGLIEAVMTLIYAIAVGISFAGTAIVARRIGEGEPERASQAAAQIIVLGVGLSIGVGIGLSYFASDILRLMGANESIVATGTDFARVMLGFNVTVFLNFIVSAIFRGSGDAVVAMRAAFLANALNIVLGPCLIFGWGPFPLLGLTGAAVATNASRGVGALYQLWNLLNRRSHARIRLHTRYFVPALAEFRTIMGTAKYGIAQLLISTTSWIGLFKVLAIYGSAALAGYTIAARVAAFVLLPVFGFAGASATLVGQNLGARKPDRAEEAVRIATRFNVIFATIVGICCSIFAHPLVKLFTTDPNVIASGSRALWIASVSFPFSAAGTCLLASFNGSGDTWTPTRLNFFCLWLFQIPFAWILANPLGLGATGIFIAVPVSFSALALWSALLFRGGQWKQQNI